MPIDRLFLIGAGGHAKVVIDALPADLLEQGQVDVVDENPLRIGRDILGRHVLAWPGDAAMAGARFHLAIGAASARARLHPRLITAGLRAASIVHAASSIAISAAIGEGSFVAARSVVAPDADIGSSVIVNHGAVVDHDCVVGDFSHIAPNATLGGGVKVGAAVLVGAGATILPGIHIGDGAVIAAGATIVRDVAAGETVMFALVRKEQKAVT